MSEEHPQSAPPNLLDMEDMMRARIESSPRSIINEARKSFPASDIPSRADKKVVTDSRKLFEEKNDDVVEEDGDVVEEDGDVVETLPSKISIDLTNYTREAALEDMKETHYVSVEVLWDERSDAS